MDNQIEFVPKCKNPDCGLEFNPYSFQLTVYLYGFFFLTGKKRGVLGFTCPKCMKTSIDTFSPKGIPWVWEKLSSRIEIENEDVNENGQPVLNPVLSFDPDLGYFSPFRLDDEICKKFNLTWCYFPTAPQNDPDFHDMLNMFLEENGLYDEDRLCTYVDGSNFLTTGGNIYWLKEEAIQNILNYEHENNIRIFPRYHYKTELLEKINVLLDTHYFSGVEVEKLKQELEKENSKAYEIIAKWTYEKNVNLQRCLDENGVQDTQSILTLIDAHQKLAAEDPKVTGAFLEVLLSDPMPIGNRLHEGYCDYLWAEKDPFYDPKLLLTGKDSKADGKKFYPMPDHFPNKLEDSERIGQEREKHSKMVRAVRENATKTYVQEFLTSELVPFLKDYEELVRSNSFSYAQIWNEKQSYLDLFYKDVQTALRDEKPYAMYREGTAWKIVFDGKPFGGLKGIGFRWIYYIISNPGNKVYYRGLNALSDGKGKKKSIENQKEAVVFAEENELELSDDSVFAEKNEGLKGELSEYKKLYKKLSIEKEQAKAKGNIAKVDRKIHTINGVLKHLDESNVEYKIEGHELIFETGKIPETKYKKINDKIKKNYRDALSILNKTKGAKELWAHLSDSIQKGEGAFIYNPPEGIDWHLD